MQLPTGIVNAAYAGDLLAIQEWFETGTRDPDDVDYGDENVSGRTLLHIAAWAGHCGMIRFLLERGSSVHVRATMNMDETPLFLAAMGGHCDAAVLLLDHGAAVNARDFMRHTPLIYFAENYLKYKYCERALVEDDTCAMIRLLLRRGADQDLLGMHAISGMVDAETYARNNDFAEGAALLADVRIAGGWNAYVHFPRFKLLALRVLCEQGRARTDDPLLRRLFPAVAPLAAAVERPREAYRAVEGGRVPRGIFWLVFEYWRSDRDSAY